MLRDAKIRAALLTLLDAVETFVPLYIEDTLDAFGALVFASLSTEYQGELLGMAQELQQDVNLLAVAQVAYELSDMCTSIVAQDGVSGRILHVRNLDFGEGLGFTDVLRNLTASVVVKRNGQPLYQASVLGGFLGILTGVVAGGFSVTVNTRYIDRNPVRGWFELLEHVLQSGNKVQSRRGPRSTLTFPRPSPPP